MSLTEVLKRAGKITGAISLRKIELLLAKKREAQAYAEECADKEESAVKEDVVVKEELALKEESTINSERRRIQNTFHSLGSTYTADILLEFREPDKMPKRAYDSRLKMLVFSQSVGGMIGY